MNRSLQLTAALCIAAPAQAQWTYSVMNAPGQPSADILAINSGTLLGSQGPIATSHATIWTSYDPASTVDLNPPGATQSHVVFGPGPQYVGDATIGGLRQAGMWNGAAFTSLHPGGYANSAATTMDGTHQFGFATDTFGLEHAFMWTGTIASATRLDPAGTRAAHIYASAAGRQVGFVQYPPPDLGNDKAGYWSGTAASFVLLPVPGNTVASAAACISPDGQSMAGQILNSAFNTAFMWQNSGAVQVPLNPAGHNSSAVYGMDARFQVGDANPGVGPRAALWQGSAASFFDLSSVLPSTYAVSQAFAVYSTATDVWVAGEAFNTGTNSFQAILWHNTIPAPGAIAVASLALATAARRRRR